MLAHNLLVWWLAEVAAVAILVALFLRWRPGFLGKRTIGQTLGRSLDARQEQIQLQLDAAQRSREEAARIHEESGRQIAQARRESSEVVERARSTSSSIEEDLRTRARAEYDRIVGQARQQIDLDRERAELALRRRAADIVIEASKQVVQQHLDPQADQRIIERSLTDLGEIH